MKTSKFNVWAFYLIAVIVLALPFSVFAQNVQMVRANVAVAGKTGVGSVADYKLNSKLMTRQMPYRVALPANYSIDSQTRYPVIYLLHGLTGHFDNWGSKTKLAEFLAPYQVIVVMPEGENGWYTDSATNPNDRYETYITQELIPEIDKNFRTVADRQHRVVAGLSMGGYV
jgi:S-formylglutathione hydrolase FrmB